MYSFPPFAGFSIIEGSLSAILNIMKNRWEVYYGRRDPRNNAIQPFHHYSDPDNTPDKSDNPSTGRFEMYIPLEEIPAVMKRLLYPKGMTDAI